MAEPRTKAHPDTSAQRAPDGGLHVWLAGLFGLLIILFAATGTLSDLARWIVEITTPGFDALSRRDQRLLLRDHPISGGWRAVEQTLLLPTGLKLGLPLLLGFAITSLAHPSARAGRTLAALSAAVFAFWIHRSLIAESGILPVLGPVDYAGFALSVGLTLILARRSFGWVITAFCAAWIAYYFGRGLLPEGAGIFQGADAGFAQNARLLTLSFWAQAGGMFGQPVQIVVGNILIFIAFGAVLVQSGAGALLIRLSQATLGGLPGGAAQGAVLGSALFGTISGAAISNVVSTGVLTIPVIRRAGFTPAFAGGVEAAASSGGQIMPPVMGVIAFFMAAQLGVDYRVVALTALAPALLFYLSLGIAVHVEAGKLGIAPLPAQERPRLTRRDAAQALSLLVPLGVLTASLFSQPSAAKAGFHGFLSAVGMAWLVFPDFRTPRALWAAMVRAGQIAAPIIVVVALVGLIAGLIQISGFSTRLSALLVALADGPLPVTLLVLGAGAVILGMGLPPGATYLVLVVALAAAFDAIALPGLSLHMFVVIFAMMSAVTPPVSIAAFAAAPIAGAGGMETGRVAARVAAMGFLLPFVIVMHPVLLYKPLALLALVGGPLPTGQAIISPELFTMVEFAWIVLLYTIGSFLTASALAGFGGVPIGITGRVLRFATGLLILAPQLLVSLPALVVGLAFLFSGARARRAITIKSI